jgi:hypothetical protein
MKLQLQCTPETSKPLQHLKCQAFCLHWTKNTNDYHVHHSGRRVVVCMICGLYGTKATTRMENRDFLWALMSGSKGTYTSHGGSHHTCKKRERLFDVSSALLPSPERGHKSKKNNIPPSKFIVEPVVCARTQPRKERGNFLT